MSRRAAEPLNELSWAREGSHKRIRGVAHRNEPAFLKSFADNDDIPAGVTAQQELPALIRPGEILLRSRGTHGPTKKEPPHPTGFPDPTSSLDSLPRTPDLAAATCLWLASSPNRRRGRLLPQPLPGPPPPLPHPPTAAGAASSPASSPSRRRGRLRPCLPPTSAGAASSHASSPNRCQGRLLPCLLPQPPPRSSPTTAAPQAPSASIPTPACPRFLAHGWARLAPPSTAEAAKHQHAGSSGPHPALPSNRAAAPLNPEALCIPARHRTREPHTPPRAGSHTIFSSEKFHLA
nr:vegetative cell wall protein gp1-like [Aegilops tauschii subsp. strangulata]